MSKRSEELIKRKHVLNEDLDSFVERYPRSKIPILPIIALFLIYVFFNVISNVELETQTDTDSILSNESVINKQVHSGSSVSINIHQLVSDGTVDEVEQQLLSLDTETINSVINGMTPLMLAASRGSVELIDLLFTQGADPNIRGSMQRTALQYAAEKNHLEAAKRLLAYGADIDAYDNGRLTPLIMAADRGYTELGIFFIEKGADLNIQHAQGWTALIDAARNGDEKLVSALLDAGADKNISMKNGMKAIDMAKQYSHKKIVDILGR